MFSSGPTVRQTSYALGCELLRGVLWPVVASGRVGEGGGLSVEQRACAGLFALLLDHPIDRRGRCRSCRRPGAVFGGRWRRCGVYRAAGHWLHQPHVGLLLRNLAHELGAPQPPALSPPPPPPRGESPAAGWPDSDHGGAGELPDRPRPRRGPLDEPPSGPGMSVLVTDSALCPT
ncbi:MAG: hypothetical protein ACRDRT_09845 [Pseudonocardiaceae bacterium]